MEKALEYFARIAAEQAESLMPKKSEFDEDQIRAFIKQNINYVKDNGYSDSDLTKIFIVRNALENRANVKTGTPLNGDAVHVYGKNGKEYANARLTESCFYPEKACICTQPSTPHVSFNKYIFTSTSGGYFRSVENAALKNIGTKKVKFWTWGRNGAGAHQGIYFDSEMNAWEIHDKDFY